MTCKTQCQNFIGVTLLLACLAIFAGVKSAQAAEPQVWYNAGTGQEFTVPVGKKILLVPWYWTAKDARLVLDGAMTPAKADASGVPVFDESCDVWVGRDLVVSPGPGPTPPRCQRFVDYCESYNELDFSPKPPLPAWCSN